MLAVVSNVVFVVVVWMTRNLQMKLTGKQNMIEWVVEFIRGTDGQTMDWKVGKIFLPRTNTSTVHSCR